MKKYKVIILLFIFLIFNIFSGCIDSEIENDDEIDEEYDYKTEILGSWTKNDTFDNFTYVIKYEFFTNNSFISGVLNDDLSTYNISIWGSYIIDNETLKFFVNGDNPSTSTHKISISEDENFLLIYYEDEIDFDVYARVKN
jgi:hypothetical protein